MNKYLISKTYKISFNLKKISTNPPLLKNAIFSSLCILIFCKIATAQTGYIYVHSKMLNEVGSPSINFSVTSGPTVVPNFTLNDEPTQISAFFDIGAAENGRLWAATNGGVLYYRDANSTVWVNTGIAGVARVDGGSGGTCYFINSAGTAFSYDGISAQVQISTTGKFGSGGGWQDISSGWTGTPTSSVINGNGTAVYAVNNDGNVYKWNGPGTTTWGTYTTIGGTQYRVDVNPTNGNVYVGRDNGGSIRTILEISTAAVPVITSLGSPVPDFAAYKDIAVNQNGEIYAVATDTNIPQGAYVFKFVSGTTWSKELGSFDAIKITGGIANSLWTTQNSGGWNGGSGWAPATGPYPFYNIFSRGFDGTIATYIDDERVRTTTGNSELIAVAPGTYTITEAAAAGWDLQKILLYDPSANSTSNQIAGTATINVSANEVVHVVYQNGELNPIVMTNSCSAAYLETFGVGTAVGTATTSGSFGSPIAGQTSYHYLAGNAPGEDGYYKIVNRANPDFNGWGGALGIVDHTPGDGALGYMYAVNAGFDKGEFFRRRFTGVIPGATYNFSAWIIDLTASAAVNPNVSFLVLDHTTQAVLGSYNTGELTSTVEPDAWQQYGFSFVATAADIDLVIGNNGFGGNGNDLALDDISFALIPSGNPVTTVTHTGCGTLGSITVTSPVGSSFEYSRDGIGWQDATSFVNLTPGVYTTFARFKGTVSCITSKIDTVKAAICGTVLNDINGLTDNTVNGSGTNTGTILYAILYNTTTGLVADTVVIAADGSYLLEGVTGNHYAVYISNTAATIGQAAIPVVTLPSGWQSTGENLGSGIGNDGNTGGTTADGILSIGTLTNVISNVNFGIQQPPTVVTGTVPSQINPGGNINVTIPSNYFDGNDQNGGVVDSITIISFPTNVTSITINGTTYTSATFPAAGVTIPTDVNGNPVQSIAINPADGTTTVVITYTATDNAGDVSVPGVVNVPFTNDVPLANTDVSTTNENTAVTVAVLTNDTFGSDGASTGSITITTQPINGTAVVNDGGTPNDPTDDQVVYTPNTNYNGNDTLTYQICDSNGDCDTALVIINIAPVFNPITISGNVLDDANGLQDNTVNGTGTNAGGLNAILIDPIADTVVAIVPVAVDGTYSFTADAGNNYSVAITTNTAIVGSAPPLVVLPSNWVSTGENVGTNAGNDGLVNGILPLGIVSADISNANIAIEQLPDTDPKVYSIATPLPNSTLTLNGSGLIPGPLSGTDNEDGTLGATNTLIITTAPAQNELYYNGVLVTNGTVITNYDPTKLTVKFTAIGSMSVVFQYVFTDAAGQTDQTPANYTITWAHALPVVLGNFNAIKQNNLVLLQWNTEVELNVQSFIIQRSTDGNNWINAGTVTATGNAASSYSFEDKSNLLPGTYYYRLAIVENDGLIKYSSTRFIKIDKTVLASIYPNPVQNNLYIKTNNFNSIQQVRLLDAKGAILYITKDVQKAIPVSSLSPGVYVLCIYGTDGNIQVEKIIKK